MFLVCSSVFSLFETHNDPFVDKEFSGIFICLFIYCFFFFTVYVTMWLNSLSV